MGRIFKIQSRTYTIPICVLGYILMSSCSHFSKTQPDIHDWSINLKDSIGILHLQLPLIYDTLHSWRCDDDYLGGDEYYYRIQSSKTSLIEESGFLKYQSDTLYRVTILQPVQKRSLLEPFEPHKFLKRVVTSAYWKCTPDTLTLNGTDRSYACIIAVDTLNNNTKRKPYQINTVVSLYGLYNNILIPIIFESTRNKCKDSAFIKESVDAAKRIRFSLTDH